MTYALFLLLLLWTTPAWAVIAGNNTQASGDTSCTLASPPAAGTSFTPPANAQVMVCVTTEVNSPTVAGIPTVTGSSGITYTQVATVLTGDSTLRTTLFTGLGNGTSGTITVGIPSDQTNCTWAVANFTGQDTVTPFVQTKTNTQLSVTAGTPFVVTLDSAFADPVNNAVYACFGFGLTNDLTMGAGFTTFTSSSGCCGSRTRHGWQLGQDLTADATNTAAGTWNGIAVEVKAAAAATSNRKRGAPRHYLMLDYFLAHFQAPGVLRGGYVAD